MRQRLVRGFAFTAGGSAAVAAVSLLRNVLIARVMGPAAFGLWNLCTVALRLTTESHLGALSAVSAKVPIHRGAGRVEAARDVERAGVTAAALLGALAGVAAALVLRVAGGPRVLFAAALLGATAALQQQFFADATVLRARGGFRRVAVLQVVFAVVHLAGVWWLVPDHYLTGALAAWAAGLLAAMAVARVRQREPLPVPLPLRGLASAVHAGFPAYLVGVTFTALLQVDRAIVGIGLGAEALGHYGILVIGGSALVFLPDALSGVLWPLAGEAYGRAREDPASLRVVTERALRGLARVEAATLLVSLVGMDLLVARAMPFYAPALAPLRPYLAGVMFAALALPLRWLLVTAGAYRAVLRAQWTALAVAVALETGAVAAGVGLMGVAVASGVASLLLLALLIRVALARGILTRTAAVRVALEAGLLCALALAIDAALPELV